MKLFLHTCCGPCFLGTWPILSNKFEVTNYFYNPNIQPDEEYERRLEALKTAIIGKSRELIEEVYQPKEHLEAIKGEENKFPKRCLKCYYLRLLQTAQKAKEAGYQLYSTTLLISPYQQHEKIKKLGEEVADETGVEFFYQDWRSYSRSGQEEAKKIAIYRQKYCGCQYSYSERS